MNIAICDASMLDREIAADLLCDYFVEKHIDYFISEYIGGADLIYDIQDGKNFDLIFLDIYMQGDLGIDVARRLRNNINYNGQIVFITGTASFAVDSYDVNAAGYLIKPLIPEKLKTVMNRITPNYNAGVYRIQQRKRIVTLKFDDILYIESSNSKCILHSNGECENYHIYKKLTDIEAELDDKRFLRCHQSFLVNMDYIKNADKNFELINGDVVCIRQRDLKSIKQEFIDYVSRKNT